MKNRDKVKILDNDNIFQIMVSLRGNPQGLTTKQITEKTGRSKQEICQATLRLLDKEAILIGKKKGEMRTYFISPTWISDIDYQLKN